MSKKTQIRCQQIKRNSFPCVSYRNTFPFGMSHVPTESPLLTIKRKGPELMINKQSINNVQSDICCVLLILNYWTSCSNPSKWPLLLSISSNSHWNHHW